MPAGITSVPLQMVIAEPVLTVIVHPGGNPVCCPLINTPAIPGTLICALTLNAAIEPGPVLPTVTCITPMLLTESCPEFSERIFIEAFAWAAAFVIDKTLPKKRTISLDSFMLFGFNHLSFQLNQSILKLSAAL
jgi:hypothetical protein